MPLLILLYGGFGSAMSVFIFHGFLKSIPYELEEASFIDGCTSRQTFFQIVLPILSPTAVTLLILNAMWIWNDYLLPSLILTKPHLLTMPIQMKVFNGTYMDNWELLIPALLLTILPMILSTWWRRSKLSTESWLARSSKNRPARPSPILSPPCRKTPARRITGRGFLL
jgi:raffinose/stachyose/melibiose transport system permease protein